MDPITAAIVAALAAGVVSGATEIGKQALVDGYHALKSALHRKFGPDSKLAGAVDDLEKEPDFEPNQLALSGRVDQVKAAEDPELVRLAQDLLERIQSQPGGRQAAQTVTGHHVAQAAQEGVAVVGDEAKVKVIRQQAGDDAIQVGEARDVNVNQDA